MRFEYTTLVPIPYERKRAIDGRILEAWRCLCLDEKTGEQCRYVALFYSKMLVHLSTVHGVRKINERFIATK